MLHCPEEFLNLSICVYTHAPTHTPTPGDVQVGDGWMREKGCA